MHQPQINHSTDLTRLWEEGYEVEIRSGYLLIHNIPYVNSSREIKHGILISTLNLIGNTTTKPETHVIHFNGEHPCNKDGSIISGIQHASNTQHLADGVIVNHSFSNKPPNGYENYHDKVTRYIEMISAPAKSLDEKITAQTFQVRKPEDENSVFNYIDTNSTRAEISPISYKLKGQKIGIIGLGGTGSYILDLIAKTHIAEIHLFDGDYFFQHNAFRAPGAPSLNKLQERLRKPAYLKEIYSNMHKHIHAHDIFIDESNVDQLEELDFVFICVDKGEAKKLIVEKLTNFNVPFIDVGIGILNIDDKLIGQVRVTTSTPDFNDHIDKRIGYSDDVQNEYSKNIQIAELNSLNASLAVIRWKKHLQFYQDLEKEFNSTYVINTSQLLNDDLEA